MSEPIMAGLVKSLVDAVSNMLSRTFDWMIDEGFKIKDQEVITNEEGEEVGTKFIAVTGNNDMMQIKLLKSAGRDDRYDMYVLGENGERGSYPQIRKQDLDDKLVHFIEKHFGETGLEERVEDEDVNIDINQDFRDHDANSSKKIQVTLSKVTASGEVLYHKIYCNYGSAEAYEDLETVIDSEEFLDELSAEPQSFEIIPESDELDVNTITEVEEMDSVSAIVKAQYETIFKLQSKFFDFTDPGTDRNLADIITTIEQQQLLLLSLKLGLDVDKFAILKSIDFESLESDPSDADWVVEEYALTLDLYYPNFPHEVQKLLDDWIFTLRYYL